MAPLYQRFLILVFLVIAFAGRIVVYAIPIQKSPVEVLKQNTVNNSEKSDSSDEENKLEAKVKLTDLILMRLSNFDFFESSDTKCNLFSRKFNLIYCHLQIPEQPPKEQLS